MTVKYEHNFSMETSVVTIRISDSYSEGSKKDIIMNLMHLGQNVNTRLLYYLNLCYRLQDLFRKEEGDFQKRISEVQQNLIDDKDMELEDKEMVQSRHLTQQILFYERFDVQELAVCNGVFLKTYALLEDVLNQLCIIYEKVFDPGYNYLDLSGAGIVRSKKYIQKVTNISLNQDDDWKNILLWNTVRNVVMHEDGKITNKNNKLKKAINKLNLSPVRDTTVTGITVIGIKVSDVMEFILLVDKVLSKFVLHEKEWGI
ncbi:hypothetical protein [Solibacillus daqui]|uniref:hypothetical protein n=1 Tax=Solibacillus daqui TaxID=2912187 RepID=UPI002365C537|nr:hypothetical protein [Solibacillus daqui]